MNHVISKEIVSIAKALNSNLVLEDLTYIRIKTTVTKQKSLITKLNSWSFFQLRSFVEYKASLEGVDLQIVKPHFSSQLCSKCGYTDKLNRKTQSCFSCLKCLYTLNADLNAAINLSRMFKHS
jgi:IS605 OrfB family transposase